MDSSPISVFVVERALSAGRIPSGLRAFVNQALELRDAISNPDDINYNEIQAATQNQKSYFYNHNPQEVFGHLKTIVAKVEAENLRLEAEKSTQRWVGATVDILGALGFFLGSFSLKIEKRAPSGGWLIQLNPLRSRNNTFRPEAGIPKTFRLFRKWGGRLGAALALADLAYRVFSDDGRGWTEITAEKVQKRFTQAASLVYSGWGAGLQLG